MFYIHKTVIIYSYCFVTWFFSEYPSIPFLLTWKVKVLVIQLCLTLCGPVDCSPSGSSVYGIFQARILKCIAIPFSRKGDPSPGSPDPGIKPGPPALQADSLPPEPPEKQCRRPRFDPWIGKIPWRGEWLPTPVFLPGGFHEQRSLEGYSPQGRKELDMTDWLTHTHKHRHLMGLQIFHNYKYHST